MYHHWPGIWFWRHWCRHIDYLLSNINTYRHNRTSQSPQRDVCRCVCVCVCMRAVFYCCGLSLHFSKGGRVRRIMGGPQRDSLEMETPLQKTLSLHKMEGRGTKRKRRVNRGWRERLGIRFFHRVRWSPVSVCGAAAVVVVFDLTICQLEYGCYSLSSNSSMLKYFLVLGQVFASSTQEVVYQR